jgi:hypothetical protein
LSASFRLSELICLIAAKSKGSGLAKAYSFNRADFGNDE